MTLAHISGMPLEELAASLVLYSSGLALAVRAVVRRHVRR
jgi:hypothetical protein